MFARQQKITSVFEKQKNPKIRAGEFDNHSILNNTIRKLNSLQLVIIIHILLKLNNCISFCTYFAYPVIIVYLPSLFVYFLFLLFICFPLLSCFIDSLLLYLYIFQFIYRTNYSILLFTDHFLFYQIHHHYFCTKVIIMMWDSLGILPVPRPHFSWLHRLGYIVNAYLNIYLVKNYLYHTGLQTLSLFSHGF